MNIVKLMNQWSWSTVLGALVFCGCALNLDLGVRPEPEPPREAGHRETASPLPRTGAIGQAAVTALSVSSGHTCALFATGRMKCWGDNTHGQLGVGSKSIGKRGSKYPFVGDEPGEMGNALPFVDLGTGRKATFIIAAEGRTCAILDNARVKCWGANDYGQLGLGDTSDRGSAPAEMGDALPYLDLGAGRTVTALSAWGYATCAVLDNGGVKCWGGNLCRRVASAWA